MKDYNNVRKFLRGEVNSLYTDIPESTHIQDMNKQTNKILDAKYKPNKVKKYVEEKCSEFSNSEQESLKNLLNEYINLFDRTLGK